MESELVSGRFSLDLGRYRSGLGRSGLGLSGVGLGWGWGRGWGRVEVGCDGLLSLPLSKDA